jgi:hypothetical protein
MTSVGGAQCDIVKLGQLGHMVRPSHQFSDARRMRSICGGPAPGAEPYQRIDARKAYRNGYKERSLKMRVGEITDEYQ